MIKKTFIMFFFLSLIIGCSNPVDTVKNSTLEDLDRSVTIGDVFNGYKYFSKTEWRHFEGAQKRSIVQFSGDIDIGKWLADYKNTQQYEVRTKAPGIAEHYGDYSAMLNNIESMKCIIQFHMTKDSKGFDIGYQGIDIIYKDGRKEKIEQGFIGALYQNEPITF